MFKIAISLFLLALGVLKAELTLEEKVGQLLMVHVVGTEVNDDARVLIQEAHVGGIIYFRSINGLETFEQVKNLSDGLQSLAEIPLLIAVDQEGGRVTHLRGEFTHPPSNQEVGESQNPALAKEIAYKIGSELKASGITMNLAPVVDVNTNPLNPVIGNRSFSSSSREVAIFAKSQLEGYKEAGIIATLKHFPGHGDTCTDSHYGLPVITKPLEDIYRDELYPFSVLAADAEVIMSAHIITEALDSSCPATFSSLILQGLLREQIGFKGVIISDSLVMEGALQYAKNIEEAAIQALNAGCDILLIAGGFMRKELGSPQSIRSIHKALVEAVRSGRISEHRLNEALSRILLLKKHVDI